MLKPYLLSDYDKSKSNNYTLIRFLFAWSVLIGHSFPITGNGFDPVSTALMPYTWVGGIAVSGFFAVSGFLVTASFKQRGPVPFIVSRVLRLYPAVIMYSLVAILIIGPLEKTVDFQTYLKADPWNNLWNALLWNWTHNLPYVFTANTFSGSTNGATWTLPAELRCYILVLLLGSVGALDGRLRANIALFGVLFAVVDSYGDVPMFGHEVRFSEPLIFFIMGSLAWVNRDLIPLSLPIAGAAFVAPFILAKSALFLPTYATCLTYLIFFAAYRLPHVNLSRYGDISYGIYIYAWPIQQIVWTKGQSGYANAAISTAIVFPIAYLSWKLVEEPALKLRSLLKRRHRVLESSVSYVPTGYPGLPGNAVAVDATETIARNSAQ